MNIFDDSFSIFKTFIFGESVRIDVVLFLSLFLGSAFLNGLKPTGNRTTVDLLDALNRDSATLISTIHHLILPGSIVWSDMWAAYSWYR